MFLKNTLKFALFCLGVFFWMRATESHLQGLPLYLAIAGAIISIGLSLLLTATDEVRKTEVTPEKIKLSCFLRTVTVQKQDIRELRFQSSLARTLTHKYRMHDLLLVINYITGKKLKLIVPYEKLTTLVNHLKENGYVLDPKNEAMITTLVKNRELFYSKKMLRGFLIFIASTVGVAVLVGVAASLAN